MRAYGILLSERVRSMERNTKRKCANSIPRIAIVAVSVLFQTGWLLLLIRKLNEYYAWIALATGLLSALVVLRLYSRHGNNAQNMSLLSKVLQKDSMVLLFLKI